MEAKAIAKGLRVSPIRARLVADMIRGKSVQEALNILTNVNNKSARLTKKVLNSAIANATYISTEKAIVALKSRFYRYHSRR